jgi:hypothetical protein
VAVSNDKIGREIKYSVFFFLFSQESKMSIEAMDKKLAKKLWEKSEVMVGLRTEDIRF